MSEVRANSGESRMVSQNRTDLPIERSFCRFAEFLVKGEFGCNFT